MVLVESKAKKWGNSIGFIVSKEILNKMDLHEGEKIVMDIKRKKRIDGFGLFRGAKKFLEFKEHESF